MNEITQRTEVETAADALLVSLAARGVDHVFGNAGTDFPPIIEAFAKAMRDGVRVPEPITVPHENVAICMAHGVYLATGRPQAVMLHVNVGTANAICGLINAARENAPIFLAAGRTPIMEGGAFGARNAFIHWGQEMFDQAAMVREAVKWEYELRRCDQVEAVVDRALTLAMTEPRGPIYLTMPREVLADGPAPIAADRPPTVVAGTAPAADPAAVRQAAQWLRDAKRPLLVTASLGKRSEEVASLSRFAEALGVGVVTHHPRYMALPTAHPSHLGLDPGPFLDGADVIVVAACDVPWIPARHAVSPSTRVVHLGIDPLFSRYPMRSFRSDLSIAGDPAATLDAIAAAAGRPPDLAVRNAWIAEQRTALDRRRAATRSDGGEGQSSKAWIAQCLAEVQRPDDVFVAETPFPIDRMRFERPGTFFSTPSSGGLGWGLGASLGLKLGDRTRRVITLVGDGSYMFGNPTPAHFVGAAMDLPTLTIVINNAMWGAVQGATRRLYPDGVAARTNRAPLIALEPSPDYEKVVTASGGYGERVDRAVDLPAALRRALHAIEQDRRSAVLNVRVGPDE